MARRPRLALWHHDAYRLPLSSLESRSGLEPRRADLVAWYLQDSGRVPPAWFRTPQRACYADLARVHDAAYLESLSRPEVLARIFGVDPTDVPVDELMSTIRLACQATVDAAREALATGVPQLNLFGGFHHAAPARGAGLCALNDVALAVAVLRGEGFKGRVAVVDVDAHPPDGLAACLAGDDRTWIGSISASDWGPLEGVDETRLPPGTGDGPYLAALDALLERMPAPDLAVVIAGGDVIAGDRLGLLGLSLEGVRARDLRVASRLRGCPSVWLPGGGYHPDAWKVLAGTALAVGFGTRRRIPPEQDPLRARFSRISKTMDRNSLAGEALLTTEDLEEALGMTRRGRARLMGFYTAEGVEYSLYAYGILPQIRRLGYHDLQVRLDRASAGERLRLVGRADGAEHVLVECVLGRTEVAGRPMLFVHWLSLRNPRVPFSELRPRLPGQDAPGLGMAREAGEMLARMARRLDLAGVAFRPAWYHVAYTCRHRFVMVDPHLQGAFEALIRDLGHLPLLEVTTAIAQGRVRCNDAPWTWTPDLMAFRFQGDPAWRTTVAAERRRLHFTLLPEGGSP